MGALVRDAHDHIAKDVLNLLELLEKKASPGAHGETERVIMFGPLFDVYSLITDKVVGTLVVARKHGLLYFRGEILLQNRDDNEPIVMLKTTQQARDIFDAARFKEFSYGSLT